MSDKKTPEQLYAQYQKTFNYTQLKYPLSTEGIWNVRGEDPNCDWGGSHIMPQLGHYTGKLEDVIRFAVTLPNFWAWGAGGDFTLVTPKSIPNLEQLSKLTAEREKLKKRIAEITKLLED